MKPIETTNIRPRFGVIVCCNHGWSASDLRGAIDFLRLENLSIAGIKMSRSQFEFMFPSVDVRMVSILDRTIFGYPLDFDE
jgi:hypothetical protein